MWDNYILLVKSKNNMTEQPGSSGQKTCRRREVRGTESQMKEGMKNDFSCVPFQWDAEWENDSQSGKWDLIFFWVKKPLLIFLISIFQAVSPGSWEDSVADHLKCRVRSIWARFSSLDTELKCLISDSSGKPVGWSLWSKTHVHIAKDWSSSFNGHKSFCRSANPIAEERESTPGVTPVPVLHHLYAGQDRKPFIF